MNRICDILNIQYPIVQAPMAWITSPELVAAVSNAGGLGILGPNAGSDEVKITIEETKEDMRLAIRKTKELTDKPFAVNYLYIPWDTSGFSQSMIDVAREEGGGMPSHSLGTLSITSIIHCWLRRCLCWHTFYFI